MTISTGDALTLNDLTVTTRGGPIVEHVDLAVGPGEVLGIVGESGSGKTTTGQALCGYFSHGTRVEDGVLAFRGEMYDLNTTTTLKRLRGGVVAFVPQDPGSSLVPSMRIGVAITEMRRQQGLTTDEARIADLLHSVGLSNGREFQRRYPHQLSGGQQQRVCLAIALSCEPEVLILDEPTTGLDVVTQAGILRLITQITRERQMRIVYVSHDIPVVASVADQLVVMYAGEVVESGRTELVLAAPRHPYTRALIEAVPDHRRRSSLPALRGTVRPPSDRPDECLLADRCDLARPECRSGRPPLVDVGDDRQSRCLRWLVLDPPRLAAERPQVLRRDQTSLLDVTGLTASHRMAGHRNVVLDDVTLSVGAGECVALLGESGSGKTTLARCVAGLHAPDDGQISILGTPAASESKRRSTEHRRALQIVFQNPRAALNPRHTVLQTLRRPARLLRGMGVAEATEEAQRLVELVRLPSSVLERLPNELSGGERQRVSIARALVADPRVIICDEVTSALDVSVQAGVLNLIRGLADDLGLGTLFITHDLGVVASVADRVLVLRDGAITRQGSAADVLAVGPDPYTNSLLTAAPVMTRLEPEATTRKEGIDDNEDR